MAFYLKELMACLGLFIFLFTLLLAQAAFEPLPSPFSEEVPNGQ